MKLQDHPTVKAFYEKAAQAPAPSAPTRLDADWLRRLCREAGADDVGLVEISRPALDNQRDDILRYFPPTKTLLSFVCRMSREPIRSPAGQCTPQPAAEDLPQLGHGRFVGGTRSAERLQPDLVGPLGQRQGSEQSYQRRGTSGRRRVV